MTRPPAHQTNVEQDADPELFTFLNRPRRSRIRAAIARLRKAIA